MKSIVDRISVLESAIIGGTQQVLLPQFVLLVFKTNDRLIRYYPGFGRASSGGTRHLNIFIVNSFISILYDFSTSIKNPLIWNKKIWKMYEKIAYST